MGFKDKLNQILYAFSSEDRYAEYDENNHHIRTAAQQAQTRADGIQLNDAASFHDDDEPGAVHSTEGVSETILAWRHIETWTSENHVDLNATLSDPCTRADITRAEQDLGIEFPAPVRASLRIHDGQEDLESLTGSGGLVFGLPLMSLSEIVEMTNTWRVVARRVNAEQLQKQQAAKDKLISPIGSSVDINNSNTSLVETKPGFSKLETDDHTVDPDLERKISTSHSKKFKSHIPKQQSFPPGFIQPVYAHTQWIPLLTDHSGNHIGVDLAPGPKGKVGQVIIFGRDFDTKFYLAPTWGDFLLMFVKDLEEGNYTMDTGKFEDMFAGEGELLFYDKTSRMELPYLRVLTTRIFKKYPEYLPKRQPPPQQQKAPQSQNINTVQKVSAKKQEPVGDATETETVKDTSDSKDKETAAEDKEVSLIDDDEVTVVENSKENVDDVTNDFKEVSI